MRKFNVLPVFLFILVVSSLLFSSSFAGANVNVSSEGGIVNVNYFYSTGCSHCANVAASGILEEVELMDNVNLVKYNVYEEDERDLFLELTEKLNISRGVPLIVLEKNGEYSYLKGDTPIIENLKEEIINFNPSSGDSGDNLKEITLGTVIIAALIDSINPCAFGVLIFLMASLLRIGSSKRALKAGLIYSIVIFITYFLVGIALYKVIDSFSTHSWFYWFYIIVAALIFILGLFQLKDIFWYGKGLTLRIPSFATPIIEKFMGNPSLGVIIILGILVSLFELPCTGEVYLGILTLMSLHQSFGIGLLLLYNFIFVLPLIVLTFLVYKGISTEKLHQWTAENKKWMKLASGLLLVGLATYIFITAINLL